MKSKGVAEGGRQDVREGRNHLVSIALSQWTRIGVMLRELTRAGARRVKVRSSPSCEAPSSEKSRTPKHRTFGFSMPEDHDPWGLIDSPRILDMQSKNPRPRAYIVEMVVSAYFQPSLQVGGDCRLLSGLLCGVYADPS